MPQNAETSLEDFKSQNHKVCWLELEVRGCKKGTWPVHLLEALQTGQT